MTIGVRWEELDDEVKAAATRGVGKSAFLAETRRLERLVEMIRTIVCTQMRPDDVEERWLAFRQEKRAMRRGGQQL